MKNKLEKQEEDIKDFYLKSGAIQLRNRLWTLRRFPILRMIDELF